MAVDLKRLHWGIVTPADVVPDLEGYATVIAIWPSPVNADACFAAAGFTEFGDSDDMWDEQWKNIIEGTLARLASGNEVIPRSEVEVYEYDKATFFQRIRGWFLPNTLPLKPVKLSLVEQIVCVTNDKRFGKVLLQFGDPAGATLLASRGHEILWIGWMTANEEPGKFVSKVAGDLKTVETRLSWANLLPRPTVTEH